MLNEPTTNNDIWLNLYQSFFNNIQIISKYYNTYTKASQQNYINDLFYKRDNIYDYFNFKEQNKNVEEFYHNWLEYSDIQIDRLTKSDDFLKLISKQFNLIVNLQKSLKIFFFQLEDFHKIYDEVSKNLYSYYFCHKDFGITPFDIEYTKGNIRLLHFKNVDNINENDRSSVLIIYATINRFHIMVIYPKKSVVKSLLSRGLDVYILDWGYLNSFEDISLYDYVNYVKMQFNLSN